MLGASLSRGAVFVVLEGPDGCGKSGQAKRLAWVMERERPHVVLTREPTDGYIGKHIVKKLAQGEADDPIEMAALFTADRSEHLREIERLLAAGYDVVSDRYYHSTLVYQGIVGRALSMVVETVQRFLRPDLTIILDVSPDVAYERIKTSRGRRQDSYDRDMVKLSNICDVYRHVETVCPNEKIVHVDGNKDTEVVAEAILVVVQSLLTGRP